MMPTQLRSFILAIVAAAVLLTTASPTRAAELNNEQIAILEILDAELAAKVVEIATKAQQWKTTIETAVATAKATGEDLTDSDPEKVAAAVLTIAKEFDITIKPFPQVRQLLNFDAELAPLMAEVEKLRAKKEELEEAKAEYEAAANRLRAKIEQMIAKLEQFRDPAAYAKNFAEGKLREWMAKPFYVGDDNSLEIKVLPPPVGTPLFSSKTKIDIEINYMDELTVKATGLYFRYKPGSDYPEPIVENLAMEVEYEKTALNQIKSLGQEMTEELDLPISINLKDKPDFKPGMGGLRGGIRFDVTIKMMGSNTFEATAKDLVLYPGNKVDWKEGVLELKIPLETPVPIGPQPVFGFWTIEGSYKPKGNEIMFGTKISTMATRPNIVALSVQVKTQIPVKSLTLEGSLDVGGIPMLKAMGKIDFTKGSIEGSFEGTDTPLKQVFFAKGKFELKREKFIAEAQMKIFNQPVDDMYCEINLTTGETLLQTTSGFKLFGVDASHTFEGRIEAGFSRIVASSQVCVDVKGVAPYASISASVLVEVDSAKERPISVSVECFGGKLSFTEEVASLSDCTPDKLAVWIKDRGVSAYHDLLQNLADADEDTRKLGAKLDQKTRAYMDAKFGGKWTSGNPQLDAVGGQLSTEWKNAGGALSDLTKQGGGALGDLNQGLQQGGQQVIDTVLSGGGLWD